MRPRCAHYVSKPLRFKSVAASRGDAPATTKSWRTLSLTARGAAMFSDFPGGVFGVPSGRLVGATCLVVGA